MYPVLALADNMCSISLGMIILYIVLVFDMFFRIILYSAVLPIATSLNWIYEDLHMQGL